jgi:phosphatidylserine/phosphatidylglycerophosphate/cardiolipin synthase-like enzyme
MPKKRRSAGRTRAAMRTMTAWLLLVTAAAAVAAMGYAGWHFYQGGTWTELHAQAGESAHRAAALARSGAQQVDTWTGNFTLKPPPSEGEIQVFFAPTTAANPSGIDDHLVAHIARAQKQVLAAIYDLELQSVADALIERHLAGVTVAVVSDSHYEDRTAMDSVRAAGIPVVFDGRNPFMHNKFFVVDGEFVWTGSMNVTNNGVFRNNNNAVLIGSKQLAYNFGLEFAEMFNDRKFGAGSPANTPYPVLDLGGIIVECYFAPEDNVEKEIVAEVIAARTAIDFMAFSFTSEPIAKAMAARIAAGVAVRGYFEKRNAGSQYSRDDYLAAAGAAVYLDTNPHSMHHKVIVIDARTVITGSYNFSKAANTQNDENTLIIHDPDIAAQFITELEGLL